MELQDVGENSSQKNLTMSSPRDHSASLFVGIAVGVLVIVNIVITAVLLGRGTAPPPPQPTVIAGTGGTGGTSGQGAAGGAGAGTVINVQSGVGGSSGQSSSAAEKIYLLAYGHDFGAYEYIDAGGYHRGFFRELADEVCTAAGVKCKLVFDKYDHCWVSEPGQHPILGLGLQNRYYDGWLGWQPTIERVHAAAFSMPFTDPVPGHFYVKPTSSFDASNFNGKNIGFIKGYADNEKCLARELKGKSGIPLQQTQIKQADAAPGLIDMLDKGDIDAIFATKAAMGTYATDGTLKEITPALQCTLGGLAVMTRADSDLPDVWNRGFQKIITNGQFKDLCDNSQENHADKGNIECIQSYNWNV